MTRVLPGLLALLVGLASAHALPAETWVLAIGNNFGDADEVGLRYAEDDARGMAEALHEVGGVASDRISILAGEKVDAVRRKLAALQAEIGQRRGPSALLVYYSGHADAEALHLDGTRLPLLELVGAVKAAGTSTRLLVLDACRSGGATRVKGVSAVQSFDLAFVEAADVEGMAVITSSTARESSLESDHLRGSFFTHFFVGGLRGAADADGDDIVTLDEVYAYAYHETVRASGRTESLQHPTFAVDMRGKGKVVLSRLADRGRLGHVVLAEPALYLVTDDSGRLAAEVNPPRAGAHLALPPGRYEVQHRRPDAYLAYDVILTPGGSTALAALTPRVTRYDRLVRKGGGERAVIHGVGVLAGYRPALVEGEGGAVHLVADYGVDTSWLSAGLRARGARTTSDGVGVGAGRVHSEAGLGLTAQRFVDFAHLSAAFGVVGEVAWHHQALDAQPDRTSWSGAFGALFAVERSLAGGLSLRVEGGPLATVLVESRVESGAEVERGLQAVVTTWLAAGLRWRL